MKTKLSFILAGLAVAALAAAQETIVVRPFRTLTFKAVAESTHKYEPQIDARYEPHDEWPENPIEVGQRQDPPNNLTAGNVTATPRGLTGPMFPGIEATGWVPADPDLAVGPNNVIEVVNMSMAFFTKTGTRTFQQLAETFFSSLGTGNFLFDPKCFYDRIHGRFVMLFLETDQNVVSKAVIAVSDDSNPDGTWYKYRLEAMLNQGGNRYWMDYPGFGYNKDAIVINGNMFGVSGGFAGVQFMVVPIAPLLSGQTATVRYLIDPNGGSAQAAEMIDPNADRIYAMSRGGSASVTLYGLTNLSSATPLLSITNVTVPSNSSPQRSAQSTNGFTLDTIDGRIFNANWRGGHLTGAHTIQSGNSIAVRWYDIATNNWPSGGTPTLNQSGNILIGGQDNHMGVATSNSLGDIAVCYTRSSSSITADLMYAARKSGDPAGTLGAPVLLENSAGHSYSGGRWGDYFGIDVDPVDEATFWGVGMDIASDNNWKTSIFSWQITAPGTDVLPTSLAMEHGSILSGGVGQLGISDDDRVQFQAAAVASVAAFDIVADIGGVAQNTNPTSLQVIVESQSPDSNIAQRVELKNQDNGQWEIIDERAVTVGTDGSVTLTISTNPGRFIGGSGNILARLSFKSTQPPAHYPWTTRVDRFIWRTTP